jgi:hypothetical protein
VRLAAWCEYIGSDRRLSIVVRRLDLDGVPLGHSGIDLLADVLIPIVPRVVSNGTDWLVTWDNGANLAGMRVAHDGTLLDPVPFTISTKTGSRAVHAVAWNGERYVVVYFRGTYDDYTLKTLAYAALVPPAGSDLQADLPLRETRD